MARLRSGDDDAATQVFNRFAWQIIALARSRLQEATRGKIDPEDILQSVLRSFFTRHRDGHFDVQNWEHLWGILTVITVRKCGRIMDYYGAARRDVRHEVSLERLPESGGHAHLFAREPTPSEATMLLELVEQLLRGLPPEDREIAVLHLQGYTAFEIRDRVGRTARTVRRILERVRKRARRLVGERPESA
jgi:RNA polymerase sigma-70 factor (ECF subfamily)